MTQDDLNVETVHISNPLSSKVIIELMNKYPNLKKITCPPSLYNRISKKYLEALDELDIDVEVAYNWGTSKYSDKQQDEVIALIKNGYSPSKIAKNLNIPVKTVYYLKNKDENKKITLKRGKKKKYSPAIRKKIKKLAKNGISPMKISKQENIPLRTVYYIINNK